MTDNVFTNEEDVARQLLDSWEPQLLALAHQHARQLIATLAFPPELEPERVVHYRFKRLLHGRVMVKPSVTPWWQEWEE
ncbi:MAG: hypothetical protein H5T62_15860 [Anaerolineae bacterium]|nr:hypothetical protein [Anaerolineae bacterium]